MRDRNHPNDLAKSAAAQTPIDYVFSDGGLFGSLGVGVLGVLSLSGAFLFGGGDGQVESISQFGLFWCDGWLFGSGSGAF